MAEINWVRNIAKNPNHLAPLLENGEKSIHQSLAIIEHLEKIQSEPALLPKLAIDKTWFRSVAMNIASEIHLIKRSKKQEELYSIRRAKS